MAKRRKLKSASIMIRKSVGVVDRRAMDLPINTQVVVTTIQDAYGLRDGAIFDEKRMEWVTPDIPSAVVVRSIRNDPLAALHAAKQVDEAQYLAGRHWQKAHELSIVGCVRAIDPFKEAVDGGILPEPISDIQRRGIADLARAARALGHAGDELVREILGEHRTLRQAMDRRGMSSDYDRKFLARRFREALETLAVLFGYATHEAQNVA